MGQLKELTERLQDAVAKCEVDEDLVVDPDVQRLMSAASEAVGALKAYGEWNMQQITYDMVKLAAFGGHWPDDWEDNRPVKKGGA